jgi:hypothetical protein
MVDALSQNITCQEATQLIPLFFDGELEGHRMREVALHTTQCAACTGALSCLAQLQHLVAEAVAAQLEEMDPSCVWQGVAEQIEHLSLPWSTRLRMWWEEVVSWRSGVAVVWASAAAVLLFLAFLWWGDEGSNEPPRVVARNQAHVESLSTSMPAIAMWSEQKDGTTVIWVAGEESVGEEQRVP